METPALTSFKRRKQSSMDDYMSSVSSVDVVYFQWINFCDIYHDLSYRFVSVYRFTIDMIRINLY